MLAADLSRVAAMAGMAAAAFTGASPVIVYVLAGFMAVASKTFRPAQAALLPLLAESPEELTAANATSTAIESVGTFVGPGARRPAACGDERRLGLRRRRAHPRLVGDLRRPAAQPRRRAAPARAERRNTFREARRGIQHALGAARRARDRLPLLLPDASSPARCACCSSSRRSTCSTSATRVSASSMRRWASAASSASPSRLP